MKDNPIIRNTIKIWQDTTKYLGKNLPSHALIPLTKNKEFAQGVWNSDSDIWHAKGIRLVGDLYQDNTQLSFQQLQQKFYTWSEPFFFRYLQVRDFIQSKVKNLPTDPPFFSDRFICIEAKRYKTLSFTFLLAVLFRRSLRYTHGHIEMGAWSWWWIYWGWLAWSNSFCKKHLSTTKWEQLNINFN